MISGQENSTDSRFAQTLAGEPSEFSKEQQDIAVAALALRSGLLTERQLSTALSNWTLHGSVPLVEHLAKRGLVAETAGQELSQQAAAHLANLPPALKASNGAAGKSALLSALDAVDPSGTVARLMGIRAMAGAGATDATGVREAPTRYRLIRKLGQGGLGRVWLAFDESLRRHVAVKEITAGDNTAALERFRREAEITGRLEHPGIVPIYQLGDDSQTGKAFYAMRFLGKTTLHDAILEYHERRSEGDDDPMLIRRLLTDFVNVCQAIGHAHSHKVIHRDLKPENVAIDSFGQVIVIDWGIAKVIDDLHLQEGLAAPHTPTSSQSTMDGQVLGTPLYMAPEQAAGRIDELDERTDIYGLGTILYAILTGCAPHERTRDEASASGERDLLSAIAGRPTPSALEVNDEVNPALAAICSKAMARRQYARYQSAMQLAEDVQRWMAGEPVSAYRERPSQRAARWVQRHRIWSQVIAALVIMGIVAIATTVITSRHSRLAARQVLFDEMRGFSREIQVQLEATAEELAKDARFMSTLPPIQGVIDARRGLDEASEGEDLWKDRLEMVFEGLLRANPDYLSISYAALNDGEQSSNLTRVERNLSDAAYVRRVPASRLGAFEDAELLQKTAALPPGEVLLTIRTEASSPDAARRVVRLMASTPVYDETSGALFGMVAIETNLLKRAVELLEIVEQHSAHIYITDHQGHIWVTDDPVVGVDIETESVSVSQSIPAAARFFTESDAHLRLDRLDGWIARRAPLDPTNRQTSVGVVLQLDDSSE